MCLNKKKENGAILLAGGKSTRMGGYPKPFLSFDNKTTFLEKIIKDYKEVVQNNITIVLNKSIINYLQNFNNISILNGIKLVTNEHPEKGRLYSLQLGIRNSLNYQYCFVHNTDNPFIATTTLKKILRNKNKDSYTVPSYNNKKGHPILLPFQIMKKIATYPNNYMSGQLNKVLRGDNLNIIPVNDPEIHININTLADYKKYFNYCIHTNEYST